jgi:Cft2 family RNA processing exonuclease
LITILHQNGLHLPGHGLWLDPHKAKPLAFVSHAHSDHIGRHREVLLSQATARLMNARLPGKRIENVIAFGETRDFAGGSVTLLPAGHILGSAQFHFETDAGSLLYTGDFKLTPGLSAEPCEWRRADTLIMETTFGLPRYRMPPRAQVATQVIAFCREAIEAGEVPVLLGYSLGKAQEIIRILLAAGLTPMLHESVWRMTEIYRELCPGFPGGSVRFRSSEVHGPVLVFPPSAARAEALEKIGPHRTAMLTGWALDSGAKFRHGCDAAFPLSDHADYDELLRYVDIVKPKRVFTVHGFAAEFAADLRRRGIEAWALAEDNQLELKLGCST